MNGIVKEARCDAYASVCRAPIRVLMLLTSTAGGVGVWAHSLAEDLSRSGIEVTLAFGPGYPMDKEIARLEVPVHHVSLARTIDPFVNVRGFCQVYRLIRRNGFDIVCTSASIAGCVGRLAAVLAGVPVKVHVIHIYASRPHQNRIYRAAFRWIERQLDRFTDWYVAPSEAMKRYGVESKIMSPGKVVVIHNGVELPRSQNMASRDLRLELGLGEATKVIGTVARFEPQKGLEYLVRAIPDVRAARPDTEFLFVGDGPLRPQLERLAQRHGVADAIRFAGWRTDVREVLGLMDVFCLPSLWEPFGMALAEAMLAGVPCVASAVDGIPEIVLDGKTGILVPAQDSRALANGILQLLDSPEETRRMIREGRERAEALFGRGAMTQAYERFFRDVARRIV